jgi:biotin-dependent carboxylase-like uncharacterized protein
MSLRVVTPGPSTLVQDAGRPGLAHLGVGPSGAFDRAALRQANRLLGNPEDAAVLETFGGLTLVAEGRHVVALAGSAGAVLVDGSPMSSGRAIVLREGSTLEVAAPAHGLRRTVAVAGGIAVPEVLGSRSRDTLAGLGPDPLVAGDQLPVGPAGRVPPHADVEPTPRSGDLEVRLVPGPRDDWFTPGALALLCRTGWRVSDRSDRIGVRLDGPPLERRRTDELPSEPVVRGSIQVTSSGLPVVLGPDHPVTGGYPVIAVLRDADVDLLAHVAPGRMVRFRRAGPARGA